jgi:opacity protein-like surface antigen
MKKLLLIAAVSLLTINALSSQEIESKESKELNFGLLAGTDFFNFSNSIATYGDYSAKNGKHFSEIIRRYLGFYIEKPISDKFAIQSEFLYSFGTESDFIEMPVLIKYNINKRFTLYSGAQLNYMLEEKNDYFKRASIGLNAGLQYDFSENWFVETRYVHRFSQDKLNLGNAKNDIQQVRLGIGYRF